MKLLILAGTSEGRELADYCEKHQLETVVSVATLYGESLIREGKFVSIHCGRMEQSEMEDFLEIQGFTHVIDATHPYATVVTINSREACKNKQIPYLRLLRQSQEVKAPCVIVESVEKAAEYLKETSGNILVTTGSKELRKYTVLADVTRLFPRILPSGAEWLSCEALGIPRQNIIGMQGPFSKELNKAMLQQIDARYLVTKEAGNAGGYTEKIEACLETGVTAIVIKRPLEETGYSLGEIQEILIKQQGKTVSPKVIKITIAGIGPGSEAYMTAQVHEAIADADICIGAGRMLEAARKAGKPTFVAYKSDEIKSFIECQQEDSNLLILMSGDVGFYSGAKKLMEELKEWNPKLMPGISSVVYLCSRLGMSWEDVKLCSQHGKQSNLLDYIRENQKVFSLMGDQAELQHISKRLLDYGMESVHIYVGINLSYEQEQILSGRPGDFLDNKIDNLYVVLFENAAADVPRESMGIPEECFIRGKVPMTKEEIRSVSLAKLQLPKDAVVYDIGAGTGSVSIELGLRCIDGTIYAIEKKEEALELIHANAKKFQVGNIQVIPGEAPDALQLLPAPTHAFIGGSSGNMEEILNLLFEKNSQIRIVINAIAIETVARVSNYVNQTGCQMEIIQMNVARGRKAGGYHLMMGENPVTIFTIWKDKE